MTPFLQRATLPQGSFSTTRSLSKFMSVIESATKTLRTYRAVGLPQADESPR